MSEMNFILDGREDLELSTQLLIRDALDRGLEVEVLDRPANFVKISKDGKVEYVKQATKTSKDSYITYLIMENKWVTKQLLSATGLRTPEGQTFTAPEPALDFCKSVPWNKVVIKPTTTNFGIGITIAELERATDVPVLAVEKAFSFSDTIIVEEFVEGDEYRFLVVDLETVAVCQRIAANVLGNGCSTIGELVEEKNRDQRRGKGHVTPLERIVLDETELGVLQEVYGYDINSIPSEGEIVFLRRNSNISTGGDSIDVTDSIDPFFKEIAQKAAASVDAKICGVDLIVPKPTEAGPYAILELNFNPVLYIHNYPYQGENRRVGEKILDLLGF